jgi:glyoxylase-like metal-dependent hydrolase (beta-lactamase superfamily II)
MKILDNLYAYIWKSPSANNCNTFVIDGPTKIIIDPGHATLIEHVVRGAQQDRVRLEDTGLIICTHAHPDHIEAVQLFRGHQIPFTCHESEWNMAKPYADMFGIRLDGLTPFFFLDNGDLDVNGTRLQIIHTPGHSPGSISIWWPDKKALFTGDCIFKDGIGRSDLPGGNSAQLKESINALTKLNPEYILPGHGDIVQGSSPVKANFERLEKTWLSYV